MAYDPEARRESKSALTIALVSLGLLGTGALAYYLTRPQTPPETPIAVVGGPTRVIEKTEVVDRVVPAIPPQTNTTIVRDGVPVTNGGSTTVVTQPGVVVRQPNVIVQQPASSTSTTSSTTVTTGVRPAAPAQSAPQRPATVNNTTVNVSPPASSGGSSTTSSAPNGAVQGDGTSEATTDSTDSTTTSGSSDTQ